MPPFPAVGAPADCGCDELKLNRPDVGWYQIRKAVQKRNESGDFPEVSFKAFEAAYKTLTEKLQPMVYELGFLKA